MIDACYAQGMEQVSEGIGERRTGYGPAPVNLVLPGDQRFALAQCQAGLRAPCHSDESAASRSGTLGVAIRYSDMKLI